MRKTYTFTVNFDLVLLGIFLFLLGLFGDNVIHYLMNVRIGGGWGS